MLLKRLLFLGILCLCLKVLVDLTARLFTGIREKDL